MCYHDLSRISLVPVISYGENEIFGQIEPSQDGWVRKFQVRVLETGRVSNPLWFGQGLFGFKYGIVPFKRPITTVVGSPIDVPKIENPTTEQIDFVHSQYMQSLQNLYKETNDKYGVPGVPMEFL